MRYDGLLYVYVDIFLIPMPQVLVEHSYIQQMEQTLHFSRMRVTKHMKKEVSFAEPSRLILDT